MSSRLFLRRVFSLLPVMKKIALLFMFLTAFPAAAYILSGEFIISMFADRRKELKIESIEIESEWTIFYKDLASEKFNAREYIKAPYEMRIDLAGEKAGGKTIIHRGIWRYTRKTGETEWKKEKCRLPVEALLFSGALEIKQKRAEIKKFGVDIEKRRMGRFDDKIGFAVGVEKVDEKLPVIWFHRRSFRPIRFVDYPEKDGKTQEIDLRFIDYSSSVSGEWYPRLIEKYINSKLVERREIISIKINPSIDEKIFKTE